MLPLTWQLVPPSGIPQGAHDRHVSTPVTQKTKRFTSPGKKGHKCNFGFREALGCPLLCKHCRMKEQDTHQAQDLLKAAYPSYVFNSLCLRRGKEVVVSTSLAAMQL